MESAVPEYILDCVRSLPPLPAAVQRLMSLARESDADFRQISEIIETDQVLTARVLRAANSAMYGIPRRVQTVRQANMILGRDAIVGLAIGASVVGMQSGAARRWPTNPDAYWKHSMAVALAARTLSTELRIGDPEEAFVAGLMHDIGKLVMLSYFGDLYAQVLMAAEYGTDPLHVLERETCETDHAVVGQALCMHWNIPNALTRAVAEHHDVTHPAPNTIADLVRTANDLVKMLDLGNGGNRYVELRESNYLPTRRLQPDTLRKLILNLPGDVLEAEQVFQKHVGAENEGESTPEPARDTVQILVAVPAQREMIAHMVLFMGFNPECITPSSMPVEGHAPVGIVADENITTEQQAAYRNLNVPILNYSMFRKLKRQPLPSGYFDARELRNWLKEKLSIEAESC